MTLNAALWAGSTALTGKAALAFWTAALLFKCFDRRKSAVVWQILLVVSAFACCVLGSVYASGPVTQWIWVASSLLAGVSAFASIRQWSKTSPREVYEEDSQIDPSIKKKGFAKAKHVDPVKPGPARLGQGLDFLGLLVAATAIALAVFASISSPKSHAWISTIHILIACVLWGVGICCAIELTFGSAPQSLSAVSWSSIAWVALGCWIVESCVAATIVLSPIGRDDDFQVVAMTRMFAISILLMDFVVWMIPHRVATFKRTGQATAWVSLTMAAWIGMLSLAVLCALPSTWPWQM